MKPRMGILWIRLFLHLKHLGQINRRPRSIESRARALKRLFRFAGNLGLTVIELSLKELEEFLDRPLCPQSRATEISHLKSFFRWCLEEGFVNIDPSVRLHRPKVPRRFPRPMKELDKIFALENAPGRIKTWLFLAAYAGLRACEIAPIKGEDILWEEGVLIIPEQKGGDSGAVSLHPLLVLELRQAYKPGWLFEKGNGYEGHITASQLQRWANRYLHSVGIESTLHTLRHWFGTEIYRSSHNIRLTQEAMRHSSVVTTALYTQIDKTEIAEVIASLPSQNDGGWAA